MRFAGVLGRLVREAGVGTVGAVPFASSIRERADLEGRLFDHSPSGRSPPVLVHQIHVGKVILENFPWNLLSSLARLFGSGAGSERYLAKMPRSERDCDN